MINEAPSKMVATELPQPAGVSNRPVWVWIITVAYGYSILSGLPFLLALLSGTMPIPPEAEVYYSSIGMFDYGLILVDQIMVAVAVVALFRLKKYSVGLWGVVLLSDLITVPYNLFFLPQFPGLIGVVTYCMMGVGVVLHILVFLYASTLAKNGVLR